MLRVYLVVLVTNGMYRWLFSMANVTETRLRDVYIKKHNPEYMSCSVIVPTNDKMPPRNTVSHLFLIAASLENTIRTVEAR